MAIERPATGDRLLLLAGYHDFPARHLRERQIDHQGFVVPARRSEGDGISAEQRRLPAPGGYRRRAVAEGQAQHTAPRRLLDIVSRHAEMVRTANRHRHHATLVRQRQAARQPGLHGGERQPGVSVDVQHRAALGDGGARSRVEFAADQLIEIERQPRETVRGNARTFRRHQRLAGRIGGLRRDAGFH